MSVRSEFDRIVDGKSDIAAAIAEKGVEVPPSTMIDGMGNLVRQIQQNGQRYYVGYSKPDDSFGVDGDVYLVVIS